ncbi:MAG: hypothetical protein F4X08_09645 [Gemmatimonadetes bacterium]|nr:hypothetical protein [Gemmatimonadota bacterium]MYD26062.1 hypothetical protein [Gemmatimonadota bacterium]MYI98635.1 hypothetical protein [Gemmatimonadota bacterium]
MKSDHGVGRLFARVERAFSFWPDQGFLAGAGLLCLTGRSHHFTSAIPCRPVETINQNDSFNGPEQYNSDRLHEAVPPCFLLRAKGGKATLKACFKQQKSACNRSN